MLNHECVPNNEVLCIKLSSYISFRYTSCLGERPSFRIDVGNAHDSYAVSVITF